MAKLAKQETPKEVAQKVSLLKTVQICAQSALDNENDIQMHKISSGTENSLYRAILDAFPVLKTREDVQRAKVVVYDFHYDTPQGTRQLGRKGATVKEFPKLRTEAPRYVANIFTQLLEAVSPITYTTDEKGNQHEVKFGYADFLDKRGLHAYPLFNKDSKDGEDGLKKIVKDKKNCPNRNDRNALIALRQQKLDDEKARNKEAFKLNDNGYAKYVKSL